MSSNLKVLQVIPKLGYGGAETGCYDVAHYLPENNCDSFIVTSGGEFPAMLLMDALIRQIPGVLNDIESVNQDSFVNGLLDHPSFTRPESVRGLKVPDILLSGDHEKIRIWRLKESLKETKLKRPDLLINKSLTKEESRLLKEIEQEQEQD